MDLNTLWFALIAVLFIGFFILEGFDYGVGILLPFVGRTDHERRQVINTIGPVWDGNEVWILTAGGAIFAAFPHWYATLFSGFYLALFLMLAALIVRGVAFEFRSKDANPAWRATWDWAIFFGSAVPALLWGVAFGTPRPGRTRAGSSTCSTPTRCSAARPRWRRSSPTGRSSSTSRPPARSATGRWRRPGAWGPSRRC